MAEVFQCFVRKRRRRMPDKRPANGELPAKFSQMPVSPNGKRAASRSTGKIKAVEIEMRAAHIEHSRAVIRL